MFGVKGGETEALRRVRWTIDEREEWAAGFRKPETSPNSLEPSTTVLSPYLKFGCLSPNLFFHKLRAIEAKYQGRHSLPPESLTGQMMWREFFYMCSYVTPNFDKMVGNPRCRQIPWDWDRGIVQKWRDGQTGYPFIDAIMTQLKVQGWIHHLARHAVACFLTRGDLWQHWEAGMQVFDELLIDDDWAINAANWLWLSCSCYFYFFYRCYSPVTFGKKTDKNGDYIRRWLPVLAKMPAQYIYEPWEAPHSVQVAAGCVVGRDYPVRIVIHEVASKRNMERMRQAYSEHAAIHGGPAVPDGAGEGGSSRSGGAGAIGGSNSGSGAGKAPRKRGTKGTRTSSSDSGSGSSLTGSGVSSESDEAAASAPSSSSSAAAAASASGERRSSHSKKRSKRSGSAVTLSDSSTSTASTASSRNDRDKSRSGSKKK
jgi:cryptochrome